MTRSLSFVFCVLALLPHSALSASEQVIAPWKVVLQLDNDLFTGTDQDYTNGARLAFIREFEKAKPTHNFLQQSLYKLSGADSDAFLHDLRLPDDKAPRFAWGIGATQLMYTPKDSDAAKAPKGERPYAGWLGLESSFHVKTDQSASSVTLSFGTTGEHSQADETQKWVHQNISNSPVYQGWDSQVPNELTVNLHLDHKRRFSCLDDTLEWPIQFDGYYEWGTALGNLRTDAYIGSLLRAGWNLPPSYSIPRVQLGSYGHTLFRSEDPTADPLSVFIFTGVRGSAVLHDITLDGPIFRDFDTGVDSKPFVGEFVYGWGIQYASCDLSFSRTIRSDEFKSQNENQEFGSVALRFHFTF